MRRLMLACYRLEKQLPGLLLFTAAAEVLTFRKSTVGIFDFRASAVTVFEALQSFGLMFLRSWMPFGWTQPIFSRFYSTSKTCKTS